MKYIARRVRSKFLARAVARFAGWLGQLCYWANLVSLRTSAGVLRIPLRFRFHLTAEDAEVFVELRRGETFTTPRERPAPETARGATYRDSHRYRAELAPQTQSAAGDTPRFDKLADCDQLSSLDNRGRATSDLRPDSTHLVVTAPADEAQAGFVYSAHARGLYQGWESPKLQHLQYQS